MDNHASMGPEPRGGGMYVNGGSPVITGCTFFENTVGTLMPAVSAIGGGLYLEQSEADVRNCTFLGNVVVADMPAPAVSAVGGALAIVGGNSLILDCTFNGNSVSATTADLPDYSAQVMGGAIINLIGYARVFSGTFCGNTATASPHAYEAVGAAIANLSPFFTVTRRSTTGAECGTADGSTPLPEARHSSTAPSPETRPRRVAECTTILAPARR